MFVLVSSFRNAFSVLHFKCCCFRALSCVFLVFVFVGFISDSATIDLICRVRKVYVSVFEVDCVAVHVICCMLYSMCCLWSICCALCISRYRLVLFV